LWWNGGRHQQVSQHLHREHAQQQGQAHSEPHTNSEGAATARTIRKTTYQQVIAIADRASAWFIRTFQLNKRIGCLAPQTYLNLL
jgi:hypothetical protein